MREKNSRMNRQIFTWIAFRKQRDPLYFKQRLKLSVTLTTLNYHIPDPDTHFHKKLQLKSQTIDINGYFKHIMCSFTILRLIHNITYFTVKLTLSLKF